VVERALFLYYPHIKVAVTEWLQGGTEDPPLTDRTFDVYFALRKLHQLMSQYDRYRPATSTCIASTLTHCACAVVRVPRVPCANTLRVCDGACAVCVDRQEKQQLLDIDKLFLPFVDKYLTQCREKLKEWSQTVPHTHAHHRTLHKRIDCSFCMFWRVCRPSKTMIGCPSTARRRMTSCAFCTRYAPLFLNFESNNPFSFFSYLLID
jgi:hypothetical protein